MGVTTNFIGVTFLYGLIYWLFDNYIWKWKPLRKVLNVPDLNGHWEGNLTSATYQTTIHMDSYVRNGCTETPFGTISPVANANFRGAGVDWYIKADDIILKNKGVQTGNPQNYAPQGQPKK